MQNYMIKIKPHKNSKQVLFLLTHTKRIGTEILIPSYLYEKEWNESINIEQFKNRVKEKYEVHIKIETDLNKIHKQRNWYRNRKKYNGTRNQGYGTGYCRYCKSEYKKENNLQRYCSKECYKKAEDKLERIIKKKARNRTYNELTKKDTKRHKKKWTKAEDKTIVQMTLNDYTISEIAKVLERTYYAVRARKQTLKDWIEVEKNLRD